jgi:hypothetical protein
MTQTAAIKTRQPEPAVPVTPGVRAAEIAFLLLLPVAAFFALHFEPVNQRGTLDPYIYTGYIHNFTDLIHRFGLKYYSVRFGLILPAQMAVALAGPAGGYFLLRYLLALIFGVPLYALCKRYAGAPVAVYIYTAALTSPFVARMVLWDHPDASGGPFLSAAICLFLMGRGRTLFHLAAGLCLGMAGNSNVFPAALFGIFLVVYTGFWIGHKRRLLRLVSRMAITGGAALAVCAAGSFYYWRVTGEWDIFSITAAMARSLSQGGMQTWRTPGFSWTLTKCHVYIPVWLSLCCAVCLANWRRSFPLGVMSCYGAAITLFYYIHQFEMGGDTLQLYYYFSFAAPAIFLMVAVLFQKLWLAAGLRPEWFVSMGVASTTLFWAASSFAPAPRSALIHYQVALFLALAALTFLVWLGVLFRRDAAAVRWLALAAIIGFGLAGDVGFLFYRSAIHFRGEAAYPELDVYRVSLQLMHKIPRYSESGTVLFWYKNKGADDINSVQSTYLWGYSRLNTTRMDDPGMPSLSGEQIRVLGGARSVVLLGDSREEISRGLESLSSHGVAHGEARSEVLASGGYRLYLAMVPLGSPGSGPGAPR